MAITLVAQNDFGTVAGANTYSSLEEFKAYCDNRLMDYTTLSGGDDEKVKAALIKALEYLDQRWSFNGYQSDADQETEFPRNLLYDARGDIVSGIPTKVKSAQNQYAFRALSADLFGDPSRDDTGQPIKSKTEKIGPITEKTDYADGGFVEKPVYPAADNIIKRSGFVRDSGGGGLSTTQMHRGS